MASGLHTGFELDRRWHWLRGEKDPARQRSKRLRDLADAQALLEKEPSLASSLSADERTLLDAV